MHLLSPSIGRGDDGDGNTRGPEIGRIMGIQREMGVEMAMEGEGEERENVNDVNEKDDERCKAQ